MGICIGQIAEILGIGQPTASHLIDRLVQAQLVSRTEDPLDRRRTLAQLSPNGVELAERINATFGPGTVQGTVLDGTAASGYQMLRREAGGGFAAFKDFALTPAVRWLQSHWEAYAFNDQPDAGYQPPTYEGRGILAGSITTGSPLTNEATLNGSSVGDVRVLQPRIDTCPGDELPSVTWTAVPSAAAYLIQTFQYRGDIRVGSEKFVYGIPAPVAVAWSTVELGATT